ncbi:TetR/AcrR family transcriptional regulator [soil metagenome]
MARNIDTRAGIVDAAARLLHEGGSEALTTRGVADAAGVQAPAIYRLFGDKEGLIEAVAEHVMATYVAEKVETSHGENLDPLDELRAGWRTHVEFGLANPELFVLLADPQRVLRSDIADAATAVLQQRVRRLAAARRLRVSEQHALDLIRAGGNGVVFQLLSLPVQRRHLDLIDAMFEAIAAAILVDGTSPAIVNPAVTTAVAFATQVGELPGLSDAERSLMSEWVGRAIDEMGRAPLS